MSPSQGFLYTGAGAKPQESALVRPKALRQGGRGSPTLKSAEDGGKQVAFRAITKDSTGAEQPLVDRDDDGTVR